MRWTETAPAAAPTEMLPLADPRETTAPGSTGVNFGPPYWSQSATEPALDPSNPAGCGISTNGPSKVPWCAPLVANSYQRGSSPGAGAAPPSCDSAARTPAPSLVAATHIFPLELGTSKVKAGPVEAGTIPVQS